MERGLGVELVGSSLGFGFEPCDAFVAFGWCQVVGADGQTSISYARACVTELKDSLVGE